MKIKKIVLNEALKVLGKIVSQTSPEVVLRSVRFVGYGNKIWASTTDLVELVEVQVEAEAEAAIDFCIEYRELRQILRTAKGKGDIELEGAMIGNWPNVTDPPDDIATTILPEEFVSFLEQVAPVVNRREVRESLQGINLSRSGITATDGKQLLHLPCPMGLKEDFTLPFPLALLAAKPKGTGQLQVWSSGDIRIFRIEYEGFTWQGKALLGRYPNWQQVIPSKGQFDYQFTIKEVDKVIKFLTVIPDCPPDHGIELRIAVDSLSLTPVDFPDMKLKVDSELTGVYPKDSLILNKNILSRMLQQGYSNFRANASNRIPVVAEGGGGQYIVMQIRSFGKEETPVQSEQEVKQIETPKVEVRQMDVEKKVVELEVPVVSPLEELNTNVEDFRRNLKSLFEESASLIRNVKEATLQQKQKDREVVQARRAIERVKMAI